jgi:hypothetical protein
MFKITQIKIRVITEVHAQMTTIMYYC